MRSEEEKMLAGELYAAFDPALLAARTRTKQLLHRLNVTEYLLTDAARAVLTELLPYAGEKLWVEPAFSLRLRPQYLLRQQCVFQRALCGA